MAILKTKTYIAVLLTLIFMAKFVAIDANGMSVLFSGSNISFVKSHCKKKNSAKQTNKTTDFSQADVSTWQVIELSGFCSSQFQFELVSWEANFSEPVAIFNEHLSSRLLYLYLDNASPPPRLA